jgi:hypothetical protein
MRMSLRNHSFAQAAAFASSASAHVTGAPACCTALSITDAVSREVNTETNLSTAIASPALAENFNIIVGTFGTFQYACSTHLPDVVNVRMARATSIPDWRVRLLR